MWNQYEGYNKVIIWFVISKKSNYCQIAESKFTFKPKTLLARSAITAPERPAPTENQRIVSNFDHHYS